MNKFNRWNASANGRRFAVIHDFYRQSTACPNIFRSRHAWHSSIRKQSRQRIILFFEESRSWLFFLSARWVCASHWLIDWLIVRMSHWVCIEPNSNCIGFAKHIVAFDSASGNTFFALIRRIRSSDAGRTAHLSESIQSFRNETWKCNSTGVHSTPHVQSLLAVHNAQYILHFRFDPSVDFH